jgi:hypothetical protein
VGEAGEAPEVGEAMSNDLALMLLEPQAAEHVQRFASRASEMLATVEAAGPIATDHDAHDRNRLAVEAAAVLKDLESLRKDAVAPIDAQRKQIQGLFASVAEPVEKAKRTLQAQLGAWQAAENARIRREQDEARKKVEAARLAEAAAKAAILTAGETEVDEAVAAANAAEAVRSKAEWAEAYVPPERHGLKSAEGSTYFRAEWTFEVCDPAAVPRAYCAPDVQAIRAAVRAGVREIEGVRIYQTQRAATRS